MVRLGDGAGRGRGGQGQGKKLRVKETKFLSWEEREMCKDREGETGSVRRSLKIHSPRAGMEYRLMMVVFQVKTQMQCCRVTSLAVQWLRLHVPNAGDPCSIPGQGTGDHIDHMPQPRVCMLQLQILHTAKKTEGPACRNQDPMSQTNK